MNENEKLIFAVGFDETTGQYKVNIPAGMSVNEVVFAFTVVIKCLVRDGVVENNQYILDTLNRYLTDPQFEEVQNETAESVQE